ncbi:hypothetical protein ACP70R_022974 [Stipagrostis hirtigluma subsp. patula]
MATAAACRECRQYQVRSSCCGGGLPRRSRRLRHRPDGADLISALPDDMLLEVLTRLGCARAATHTSLLSRRWRGLWTRLPRLTFHYITPDSLDAAIAMATCPELSLLDIHVVDHHKFAAARVSSLLQAAARLAPAKLSVLICGDVPPRGGTWNAIELPCFRRTTTVSLDMSNIRFTLPIAGDFPVLESLTISSCQIDLVDLLPRCPSLRKLKLYGSGELHSVTVHAPLLEELGMCTYGLLKRIDIMTPLLKKLDLRGFGGLDKEFSLSYSAPVVEELLWFCSSTNATFGRFWRLGLMELKTQNPHELKGLGNGKENTCLQLQHSPRVNVLLLYIGHRNNWINTVRSIKQEISQFVVASFSNLELKITRPGHVYGAMVLHVLEVSTFIQRLKVELCEVNNEEACSINCPCDQPNNWRSQSISLSYLKEVEIHGFRGQNHEVDLLKVIFRSATMLERMALRLSNNVSPSCNGCMEVCTISKAYPSVKCNIYHCSGEQVSVCVIAAR